MKKNKTRDQTLIEVVDMISERKQKLLDLMREYKDNLDNQEYKHNYLTAKRLIKKIEGLNSHINEVEIILKKIIALRGISAPIRY